MGTEDRKALEDRLRALEARAGEAHAEAARLRGELAALDAAPVARPTARRRGYLLTLVLFNIPSLLVAVACLLGETTTTQGVTGIWVSLFAGPTAVLATLSALVTETLELRRERLPVRPEPSLGRTTLRYVLLPGVLAQLLVLLAALFMGWFSLSGSKSFRAGDFLLTWAVGTGLELVVLLLPIWLVGYVAFRRERSP